MYKLFVDGSFANNRCGSGWVLVDNLDRIVAKESVPLKSDNGMRQVTGELNAVMFGIYECLEREIKELEIHFDYLGIREWVTGAWKAKNVHTQNYRDLMRDVEKEINIKFVKVKAHSGNYFNDLADKLSKEACDYKWI